jgi:HEAT repeat protein
LRQPNEVAFVNAAKGMIRGWTCSKQETRGKGRNDEVINDYNNTHSRASGQQQLEHDAQIGAPLSGGPKRGQLAMLKNSARNLNVCPSLMVFFSIASPRTSEKQNDFSSKALPCLVYSQHRIFMDFLRGPMVPAKINRGRQFNQHSALWAFVCLCTFALALAAHGQTDSVSQLILQLRAPNVRVRRNAAISLGDAKDPRSVAPLIAALHDGDPDVRQNAARSLGLIGTPAIDPLIGALRGPSVRDRDTVVEALGKIGLDALPATILALKDPDPSLRASAAAAISFIEGSLPCCDNFFRDPSPVEPLLASLKDVDWKVRHNAVRALAEIKDARAVGPLITMLSDSDARVRSEAAYVLGGFGDASASDPLLAALNDPSPDVRLNAACSLAELQNVHALQPLSIDLQSSDIGTRGMAIDALIKLGTPAIDVLIDALNHSDAYVEHSAAAALTKIDDPRAVAAISARKDHLSAIAKNYAAIIAAGKSTSLNPLIDALNQDGDMQMAEAFLNSGNKQLRDAAKEWAIGAGYSVVSFPQESKPVKWGGGH